MSEETQKRIFFETIGGNEKTFCQERELESEIAKQILDSPPEMRDKIYREEYEKLHKFFITVAGSERLYKGVGLQRALLKQKFIGKIIGVGQHVLEVGCGEGIFSIALSRQGNFVTGVDVSDTCVLLAKRNKQRFKASNVNYSRMSATQLDFPARSFDWIVSMDLIEHLHPEDAVSHLKEAARLLKPKGKYLIMTPNSETGAHAGDVHIKEYTFKELEQLFKKTGFTVKAPLLNIISPLNIQVTPKTKTTIKKLTKNRYFNFAFGIDPIVLIATK